MITDPTLRSDRRGFLAALAGVVLSLAGARPLRAAGVPWDDAFELAIDLVIAQPGGSRARRPYVAVWVEDATGASVRTLALWVQRSGRGSRWIPDLRRWYRAERARQSGSGGDLVATASSATRAPGSYTLVWNGRDDAGRPVEQGEYSVCVEVAREHGTYQLARQSFSFASRPFAAEIPGNVEVERIALDFRRKR